MSFSFIQLLTLSLTLILTSWVTFSRSSYIPSQPKVKAADLKSGSPPFKPKNLEQITAINQRATLRKLVPVTEPGFSIDYNYQKLKFVVTLSEPVTENTAKFQKWLQTFGFESIEPDRFELLP